MYRIVYDKQAVKDIKNLKSARLDDKAKKLIEVIGKPFSKPPPYEAAGWKFAGSLFAKNQYSAQAGLSGV